MIILIDNYDSFTFNIYHYFGEIGAKVKVFRNDKIAIEDIMSIKPKAIISKSFGKDFFSIINEWYLVASKISF